jgi:hypothetical protein
MIPIFVDFQHFLDDSLRSHVTQDHCFVLITLFCVKINQKNILTNLIFLFKNIFNNYIFHSSTHNSNAI